MRLYLHPHGIGFQGGKFLDLPIKLIDMGYGPL
jgi:hypothetical protein